MFTLNRKQDVGAYFSLTTCTFSRNLKGRCTHITAHMKLYQLPYSPYNQRPNQAQIKASWCLKYSPAMLCRLKNYTLKYRDGNKYISQHL